VLEAKNVDDLIQDDTIRAEESLEDKRDYVVSIVDDVIQKMEKGEIQVPQAFLDFPPAIEHSKQYGPTEVDPHFRTHYKDSSSK
jgi:hypothetical protein